MGQHLKQQQQGTVRTISKRARPEVLRMLDNVINKLDIVRDDYSLTGLADSNVEANLRQAEYIIMSIKHDLKLVH